MQVRHLLQLVLSFELRELAEVVSKLVRTSSGERCESGSSLLKKMRHYVFSDVVPFRIILLIIIGRSFKGH